MMSDVNGNGYDNGDGCDDGGGGSGSELDDGCLLDPAASEEQPLISPRRSVAFVPSSVANMPLTSTTPPAANGRTSSSRPAQPSPSSPQPPYVANSAATLITRKLLRSGVGAALTKSTAGKRSVYRWLHIRRLDRSRLLVFTICVAVIVYVVAWLNGLVDDTGGPGGSGGGSATRVVVVRDGSYEAMSEEDEMLSECRSVENCI